MDAPCNVNATSVSGYRDDHLHLLACAAARRSADVSGARSIAALLDLIGVAARGARESGKWLRGWGYDDALLAERRHLNPDELDAVTLDVPTVLHHITGHVAVVNSAAGRSLGLFGGSVLVERHDLLEAVPQPSRSETVEGVAGVLADLAAAGFGACTDATHTNDLNALELIADAAALVPSVSVTAMVGAHRLDSLGDLGFGDTVGGTVGGTVHDSAGGTVHDSAGGTMHDSAGGTVHASSAPACGSAGSAGIRAGVRIGHAKVMPPHDNDGAIAEFVAAARERRFPAAVHVMDIDTLAATLDALEAHPQRTSDSERHSPRGTAPDRIEHCALALPEQADRIARLGIKVVTQPSFVTRRAQKYREQLSVVEQKWLWPLASLLQRGIEVSFSSDAPTVPSDPAEWVNAAAGRDLGIAERIDRETAHRLCLADH